MSWLQRCFIVIIASAALLQIVHAEPVYSPAAGDQMVWQDNFDRYTSLESMAAAGGSTCGPGTAGYGLPSAFATYGRLSLPTIYSNGEACDYPKYHPEISLIAGRGGTGQATRLNVTAKSGEFDPGGFTSPVNPYLAGNYSGALVVQYWFRLSTTAQGSDVGYKWGYYEYVGDNSRTEVSPGNCLGCAGVTRFGVNPDSGGVGVQPVGPYFDWTRSGQPPALNDGNWHRWTFEYKANTVGRTTYQAYPLPVTSRDGYDRVWIDGIKIIDVSNATLDVTPPGGDRPWCYSNNPILGGNDVDSIYGPLNIDYFRWPGNLIDPPSNFTIDWDDLQVWSTNQTTDTTPSQNQGDLNDDGRVDFLDLLIVINDFRHSGAAITNTRADINGDGAVNLFDFVLLARNWGKVYT